MAAAQSDLFPIVDDPFFTIATPKIPGDVFPFLIDRFIGKGVLAGSKEWQERYRYQNNFQPAHQTGENGGSGRGHDFNITTEKKEISRRRCVSLCKSPFSLR